MLMPVMLRSWLQVSGLLCLTLLLVSCGEATPAPSPSGDVAQTGDGQSADVGSDAATASDVAADSLGGSDTSQPCSQACIDSDNNPCTYAVCEAGQCKVKLLDDASACEDGDPCTIQETCEVGTCTPSTAFGSNLCACEDNADCAPADDGLACNGSLYCDKNAFPYTCKVNPATVPPCESQTPPSSCLTASCVEPAAKGGKAQCSWTKAADTTPCNDGNDLTEGDICLQGSCQPGPFVGSCQTNSDCAKYEDGNLCNGQLFCNKANAKCQLNPATLVVCPTAGDTACLRNTCVPTSGQCLPLPQPDGFPCDDTNTCTITDACLSGTCSGTGNACACATDADCGAFEDGDLCNGKLYCNLQTASCQLNPATIVHCGETSEPCQQQVCLPATGTCTSAPADDGTPCNADNNLCTPSDSCSAGACQPAANLCACSKDADCAIFDDQDQCNGQLYCNLQNGSCEPNPATVVVCDPMLNTTCSVQQCLPLSGDCTAVATGDGLGCDDGDSCTLGESCLAGSCVGGSKFCACSSDLDCAGQEDGNYCNGQLYCDTQSNTCQINPGSIVLCNDPTPTDCFASACVPATGLCEAVTKTAGVQCDDGDLCTLADSCTETGACVGGVAGCGCATDLDCAGLDDGDVCTGEVYCDLTVFPLPQCAVGPPIACSEVTCAAVSCNSQTGACESVPLPEAATCSDGDPCTVLDSCLGGQCTGGARDCDDANACTADLCAAGDCQHLAVADNLPCDDGSACTPIDYCQDGVCEHTEVFCNDENSCTVDYCNPETGSCDYQVLDAVACDDYDSCTVEDTCDKGNCSGTQLQCAGLGPNCLVNLCVDGTCQDISAPDDSTCDDGNPCSQTSYCNRGACEGTEDLSCDDGLPCTTDPACNPGLPTGCTSSVNDGNPTTYWSHTASTNDYSFFGLAHESGRWATVAANGVGTDPLLRVWDGPGTAPTNANLIYPGNNYPLAVAGDRSGGWLVAGYNGPNSPGNSNPTVNAQPLLMRTTAAGVPKWATTSLISNAVITTIAGDAPDLAGHVILAGVRNAHVSKGKGLLWIAEVDVSGASGPALIRSGHCSGGMTSFGQQGVFANAVTRLTGGDWLVGGFTIIDYDGNDIVAPAWCRFDSDLKVVGSPNLAPLDDANTGWQIRGVFATQNGGFWSILTSGDAARWQTFDAAGQLVSDLPIPFDTYNALAAGNGLLLLGSQGDGSFLSQVPSSGSLQEAAIVKDLGAVYVAGMVRDPTGIAWLQQIGSDLTLVHVDDLMADTCEKAEGCGQGCHDNNPCTADLCVEGQCQNPLLICDDANACSLDQCNDSGCESIVIDGTVCDDGVSCTVDDVCAGPTCKGIDRLGISTTIVTNGEVLVDGVVHGDGLLVLGHRPQDGVQTAFWRKYNGVSQVVAEAELVPGTAVALARSALSQGGGFDADTAPSAIVLDDQGQAQLWYLAANGQAQEPPVGLPGYQSLPRKSLVQKAGQEVALLARTKPDFCKIFAFAPGGQWTELVTVPAPNSNALALVAVEDQWVVVLDASDNAGGVLELKQYDNLGQEVLGASEDYNFSGSAEDLDGGCHGVHVHDGNVLVSCGDNNVIWYTPMGTTDYAAGSTLQLVDSTRGSSDLTHRTMGGAQGGLALAGTGSDGEWSLYLHDGLFNVVTSLPFVATSVPVVTGNDTDIWAVTQTPVGNTTQVTVHHWDAYGNSSCQSSGECYAEQCNDAGFCSVNSCPAGTCSTKYIGGYPNCVTGEGCQWICGGA